MKSVLVLGSLFLLAGCGTSEQRRDGVSSSDARALDNAATKVEAEQLPADRTKR